MPRSTDGGGSRPEEMHDDGSTVRMSAVFPEVDSLPGAQGQRAFHDGDGQIHRSQGGAHMRRHIIIAFAGVLEKRITIRNEPGKESFEIPPHFGIGIFLNQKRSGSVLEMEGGQAGRQFRLGDEILHGRGELVKSAPFGRQSDFMNTLLHKTFTNYDLRFTTALE